MIKIKPESDPLLVNSSGPWNMIFRMQNCIFLEIKSIYPIQIRLLSATKWWSSFVSLLSIAINIPLCRGYLFLRLPFPKHAPIQPQYHLCIPEAIVSLWGPWVVVGHPPTNTLHLDQVKYWVIDLCHLFRLTKLTRLFKSHCCRFTNFIAYDFRFRLS